jgi:hypothetical protein
MKKALIRVSLSVVILSAVSVTLLYSIRSRPVIFCFPTDPTIIRPRTYCLMNPFRDKSPEIIAENYLEALRKGDVESIRPFINGPEEDVSAILGIEKKWPILSWRIGDRRDRPGEAKLMFWVRRGGGYSKDGIEENVSLWFKQSGNGWNLNAYSAIY